MSPSPPPPFKVNAEYTSVRDQVAIKFGRQLAASLTHPEVREFIKTSVLEQFDGDYNFLFGTHKDKTLQVTAPDGRTSEMRFKEVLFGPGATNTRSQESAFLDSLAEFYPLLQIALPELEAATAESWETANEIPLIAIVPENMEKKGITTVTAYDTEGNTYELSVEEEPDKLVIVVSGNEGLIGVEKQAGGRLDCPIEGIPYYSTENVNYYFREDYYASTNLCNGGGIGNPPPGGGDNCPCDRECKSTAETLFKLKFIDISKLREVEPWISGKVELRFAMVYLIKPIVGINPTTAYFDAAYTGKRKEFRECYGIWGNCTPIWKSLNRTFTEYLPDFGSKIKVAMFEEDEAFPDAGMSDSYVYITTEIDGQVYSGNVAVQVKTDNYDLGDVEVLYCDRADPPGKLYTNQFIDFYWGQN